MWMCGGRTRVGPAGYAPWHYGLEPVAAFCVGLENAEAFKVRIEWRGIGVSRMGVSTLGVGLPDFDLGVAHRLALEGQDASHHVDDLPRCSLRLARQMGQVARAVGRFSDRIERPEDLVGRAAQRCPRHCKLYP